MSMAVEIGYGKQWWASLRALDGRDVVQVAKAMDQFCKDPSHPGLNLERLQGDGRLWSIRASQSIRILLAREGNVYVVLEAGQHDEIYARARRCRFVSNPTTGFVGMVPIEATDEGPADLASTPNGVGIEVDRPATGVLDHWSDAELAEAGFATTEIEVLRTCTSEEHLCELNLPSDVIERAIDLLEVTPEEWRSPPLDAAFAAEQRLRDAILASPQTFTRLLPPDEAAALATAPIEDWMVFLHPDQRQAAERRHAGPARVRGSAGTGKTVVALHRAAELARRFAAEGEPGQILFTTYIKNLPPVLESLYQRLPGAPQGRVEFLNVDKLAFRICAEAGDRPSIDLRLVDAAFASAYRAVVTPNTPLHGLTRQYLRDEVNAVIKGRGLRSVDEYLAVERIGRRTPFTEPYRRQAWHLREEWDRQMQARHTVDFPDVLLRALDHARRLPQPRYRAAIIDEAQDLTLVGLQLIRALVNGPAGGDRPDGLFIVGDGAQRIYAGGFTLRQAGVDVRGRTTVLRVNYRNTRQIIGAAMAVAGQQVVDDLGDEQRRGDADAAATRDGAQPVLKSCASHDEEVEFVVRQIEQLSATGSIGLGDLAVAVGTNAQVREVREALTARGVATQLLEDYTGQPTDAVKVGTHFRIKGLEFKVVFLPFLGADDFPHKKAPGQDEAEYAEQTELAVSRLFVAMTRARDGLFVTCTGEPSPVLGPGIDEFDVL